MCEIIRFQLIVSDKFWFCLGSYCGLLATIKFPSKLPPEVEALKFMHISEKNCEAERLWPIEVGDLMNLFTNRITFCV